MTEEENVFENVVEEHDEILGRDIECPATPKIYDPEWHDYVMQHFTDDELDDGAPTCDGLRRVTEKLIGPIISREVTYLNAPQTPNGIATVAVSIEVAVENTSIGRRTDFDETCVADVGPHNTQSPFSAHQSATAETRAEARALRKILRLRRIIAAEEKAPVNQDLVNTWEADQQITDEQVMTIDIMASRLNINVMEFINSGKSGKKYNSADEISQTTAAQMIQYLNAIQQNTKPKPNAVGVYDPNWRDNGS